MRQTTVLLVSLASILAAAFLLPFRAAETRELLPVRTLVADVRGGRVALWGDGGLYGVGFTTAGAVEDMLDRGDGQIWLAQTEFLLLTPAAEGVLQELAQTADLRMGCAVFRLAGGPPQEELDGLTEYLSAWTNRQTPCTLAQALERELKGRRLALPVLLPGGEYGEAGNEA